MASTITAPLAGKVAIVTGGSRGIGACIATTLAKQGCTHISITYTSKPEGAEETLKAIQVVNPTIKTTAIKADLLDDDFATTVVQGTLKNLETSHVDIVIANAAIVTPTGINQPLTKADFDKNYTGNVYSQYDLARTAIEVMPPEGRIVFLSSVASKFPMQESNLPYCVTKAGLDTLSRILAAAWGVEKGVTVNTISVGATRTDAFWGAQKVSGLDAEGFVNMAGGLSNLKRIAEVQEVADIVAFVASPAARWINGNQIPANGGILSVCQS